MEVLIAVTLGALVIGLGASAFPSAMQAPHAAEVRSEMLSAGGVHGQLPQRKVEKAGSRTRGAYSSSAEDSLLADPDGFEPAREPVEPFYGKGSERGVLSDSPGRELWTRMPATAQVRVPASIASLGCDSCAESPGDPAPPRAETTVSHHVQPAGSDVQAYGDSVLPILPTLSVVAHVERALGPRIRLVPRGQTRLSGVNQDSVISRADTLSVSASTRTLVDSADSDSFDPAPIETDTGAASGHPDPAALSVAPGPDTVTLAADSSGGLPPDSHGDHLGDHRILPANWSTGSGRIFERSGRLEFAKTGTSGEYDLLTGGDRHSLRSGAVSVEVVSVGSTMNGDEVYLSVGTDAENAYKIVMGLGSLIARTTVRGLNTNHAFPAYDSINHRWWRIRESGGMIHFEASKDRATWVNLYSRAADPGIPLDSVQVTLAAGQWQTTTASTVVYGNLHINSSNAAVRNSADISSHAHQETQGDSIAGADVPETTGDSVPVVDEDGIIPTLDSSQDSAGATQSAADTSGHVTATSQDSAVNAEPGPAVGGSMTARSSGRTMAGSVSGMGGFRGDLVEESASVVLRPPADSGIAEVAPQVASSGSATAGHGQTSHALHVNPAHAERPAVIAAPNRASDCPEALAGRSAGSFTSDSIADQAVERAVPGPVSPPPPSLPDPGLSPKPQPHLPS